MMRDAVRYGVWSTLTVFVVVSLYINIRAREFFSLDTFSGPVFLVSFATFPVALLGWITLHFRARKPGWISYSLLAIGVVLFTQLLLGLPIAILMKTNLLEFPKLNGWILVEHGWFTIPVALAGTMLFVRWLKHEARNSHGKPADPKYPPTLDA